MAKARKFKKKLGLQKLVRRKAEPVLSVNLIGKEYVKKAKALIDKLISLTRSFKLKIHS